MTNSSNRFYTAAVLIVWIAAAAYFVDCLFNFVDNLELLGASMLYKPSTRNFETPEIVPPLKSFKVTTVTTDFVGRLISDERTIRATSAKAIKRSIYLSLSNVRSISIVEVVDKN